MRLTGRNAYCSSSSSSKVREPSYFLAFILEGASVVINVWHGTALLCSRLVAVAISSQNRDHKCWNVPVDLPRVMKALLRLRQELNVLGLPLFAFGGTARAQCHPLYCVDLSLHRGGHGSLERWSLRGGDATRADAALGRRYSDCGERPAAIRSCAPVPTDVVLTYEQGPRYSGLGSPGRAVLVTAGHTGPCSGAGTSASDRVLPGQPCARFVPDRRAGAGGRANRQRALGRGNRFSRGGPEVRTASTVPWEI